jgi:hypothetical protein
LEKLISGIAPTCSLHNHYLEKKVPAAKIATGTIYRGTTQLEKYFKKALTPLKRLTDLFSAWKTKSCLVFHNCTLTGSHQPPAFLHPDTLLLDSDTYICLFD